MLKPFSIISPVLFLVIVINTSFASPIDAGNEKEPVIITSQTLTADNKNNTAVFEGSVLAKSGDIEMYSDKMTVFYSEAEKKIQKIHAVGHVKVHKKERALFSDEAVYLNDNADEKIIFTGNPKAVEGENVITGKEIIYYIKDDRVVVQGSRVILQNNKRLN
jgi:lipopolysaccharide export system protein LptA